MSKSSLIIDTPKYCYLCSCYAEYEDVGYCQGVTVKRVPTEGKPSWCPLKPYKKVDAIPVEWIEKWINDRTKIWVNPKYADMEFTEVPFDYYEKFTPYQAISMLDDWKKENESEIGK